MQSGGEDGSLAVDFFTFSSSIADYLKSASLVISHAGKHFIVMFEFLIPCWKWPDYIDITLSFLPILDLLSNELGFIWRITGSNLSLDCFFFNKDYYLSKNLSSD